MENFIFSLNATIPIFLIIILGWVLMQVGIFNKEFTTVADRYVFKVALPLLVFKDIATADIYEMFNLKFVLFCAIGTTLMFLGVWLFAHWYCKDRSMIGAFTQAAARGSAAILGIAFVENIYGNSGMVPMMIVSAVPLYNIFSVVILTFGAQMRIQQIEVKIYVKLVLTLPKIRLSSVFWPAVFLLSSEFRFLISH